MKDHSPAGAQRLADAVDLLRANIAPQRPADHIIRALSLREHYSAGIDVAIQDYGLPHDIAAQIYDILDEFHRIPMPALTGIIDPRAVSDSLVKAYQGMPEVLR